MAVTRRADDAVPRIPHLQRVAEVPVLHDRESSCLFFLPRASAVVPMRLVPGLDPVVGFSVMLAGIVVALTGSVIGAGHTRKHLLPRLALTPESLRRRHEVL